MHSQYPTARIISYAYDAYVVGIWKNISGEGLRGHEKALAYAISNSRPNEVKRRIFFIVHSVGGLVTEQAFSSLWSRTSLASAILLLAQPESSLWARGILDPMSRRGDILLQGSWIDSE